MQPKALCVLESFGNQLKRSLVSLNRSIKTKDRQMNVQLSNKHKVLVIQESPHKSSNDSFESDIFIRFITKRPTRPNHFGNPESNWDSFGDWLLVCKCLLCRHRSYKRSASPEKTPISCAAICGPQAKSAHRFGQHTNLVAIQPILSHQQRQLASQW